MTNLRYLYKGFGPPLVGMAFEKAVVFGTFHNIKTSLPDNLSERSKIAISGAVSGISASFIVSPYERLKI